jgi:hypothetical protein
MRFRHSAEVNRASRNGVEDQVSIPKLKETGKSMAKIAKTGDRRKEMDTTKSTDCPKCSKPTRIVKRVKDRERGVPGGVYISCSACDFYEKL